MNWIITEKKTFYIYVVKMSKIRTPFKKLSDMRYRTPEI